VIHRKVKKDVPWWGKWLQEQRREVRRLQNALTAYTKKIRRLKTKWFVIFSEEIVDALVASRLGDTHYF
jgi:hypothetical protein